MKDKKETKQKGLGLLEKFKKNKVRLSAGAAAILATCTVVLTSSRMEKDSEVPTDNHYIEDAIPSLPSRPIQIDGSENDPEVEVQENDEIEENQAVEETELQSENSDTREPIEVTYDVPAGENISETPVVVQPENIVPTDKVDEEETITSEEEHIHEYSEWRSYNDSYEVRVCECGHFELRAHSYLYPSVEYISSEDDIHTVQIVKSCDVCGHTVVESEKAECTYVIDSFDQDFEYKRCIDCGHIIKVEHEYSTGVNNGDGTITYRCTHEGCENIMTKKMTISKPSRPSSSNSGSSSSSGTTPEPEKPSKPVVPSDPDVPSTPEVPPKPGTPTDPDVPSTPEVPPIVPEEHVHSYGTAVITYEDITDEGHTVVSTQTCEVEGCDEPTLIEKSTVEHVFDDGVINEDKTNITYSCVCGHTKTDEYVHIHSEAPEDLEFTFKSSNKNGTHNLVATYVCSECGEEITKNKTEDCNYGKTVYESVGITNPYNVHNAIDTCETCGYKTTKRESCVPVGEMKYIKIYDNIYQYYDCEKCHGYVDRDYHTEHVYGEWECDDNRHIRYCGCVEGREQGTHEYSFVPDPDDQNYLIGTCDICGYSKRVLNHEHAPNGMDIMDLLFSPFYDQLVSKSNFTNPNPSLDDYCYRYDVHCSTCGENYSITYEHDFDENGVCKRIDCGVINTLNNDLPTETEEILEEILNPEIIHDEEEPKLEDVEIAPPIENDGSSIVDGTMDTEEPTEDIGSTDIDTDVDTDTDDGDDTKIDEEVDSEVLDSTEDITGTEDQPEDDKDIDEVGDTEEKSESEDTIVEEPTISEEEEEETIVEVVNVEDVLSISSKEEHTSDKVLKLTKTEEK